MKNDYSKQRRDRLKLQGLCTACGKVPKCNTSVLCDVCRKKHKASIKQWRKTHMDHYHYIKNKSSRKCRRDARITLIKEHGGRCSCCGEDELKFLQIHHIDSDGKLHRKETWNICADLIKNPQRYKISILCADCHNAITYYGSCPHADISAATEGCNPAI